jgi:hypothetical protein
MAEAISRQTGVGGIEVAGTIISYLAHNPDRTEHVLKHGIIDEPDMWLNGRLTWHGQNGQIVTPEKARLMRIVRSMEGPKQ